MIWHLSEVTPFSEGLLLCPSLKLCLDLSCELPHSPDAWMLEGGFCWTGGCERGSLRLGRNKSGDVEVC